MYRVQILRGTPKTIVPCATWVSKQLFVSLSLSPLWWWPQSRQSDKFFFQSSELGLPQPLARRRVCPPPPPPVLGGLAREGAGESKFRRGDIHFGTIYIYVLCGDDLPHPSWSRTCWARSRRHTWPCRRWRQPPSPAPPGQEAPSAGSCSSLP